MKILFLFWIGFLVTNTAWAQSGCTDPEATNYEPAATTNNGSCAYPATAFTLTNPKTLPATLNENSGLIYTNGQLWTLNDSGGSNAIYKISETDGSILQTVTMTNATNIDWEAMTADANYFYIGDFGNNSNGSRTDLKIYRVSKSAIGTGAHISVSADIINFSYQDQVNPVPTGANNTKFDCEAFLVKDNQLHLFTKDWIDAKTALYTLPVTPGTHIAQRNEEFAVNGLITDAHISATNVNEIVLIGYTKDLFNLFICVLWDYTGNNFFSGNKRRVELGSSLQGQIEGVTFTTNGNGYISSERIDRSGFVVSPRLYTFSIAEYVPLPVTLIKFTTVYKNPGVVLSWQTASETNNDFFTVERSVDAIHFEETGRKKGAGNSRILIIYSFTDPKPYTGTSYYRLKQTDFNGSFTYSPVRAVTVAPAKFNLNIFPVPTQSGQPLQFQFIKDNTSAAKITLTGMDGNVWLEKELAGALRTEESIPTNALPAGMYLLKVTDQKHAYTAKVLIK